MIDAAALKWLKTHVVALCPATREELIKSLAKAHGFNKWQAQNVIDRCMWHGVIVSIEGTFKQGSSK